VLGRSTASGLVVLVAVDVAADLGWSALLQREPDQSLRDWRPHVRFEAPFRWFAVDMDVAHGARFKLGHKLVAVARGRQFRAHSACVPKLELIEGRYQPPAVQSV